MDFTRVAIAGAIGAVGGAVGALVAKAAARSSSTEAPPGGGRRRGMTPLVQSLVALPALAIIALSSALGWDVAIEERLFPEKIFANSAERVMAPLLKNRHYAELIRGKSPAEVMALSRELSAKGLRRLSTPDLMEIGRFRRSLSEVSPAVCAQLWTGSGEEGALNRATASLPRERLEKFFAIVETAIRLEVDDATEYSGPAEPPVDSTLAAIRAALGSRGDAFEAAIVKGKQIAPAEACAAMTMLFDALKAMPEPHARAALTLFAQ